MEKSVHTFTIVSDYITPTSAEIYQKLGLSVVIEPRKIHITASESTKIKSVAKGIHVHIYDQQLIAQLLEQGFVINQEEGNKPVEIIDEFGNKIIVSYMFAGITKRIAILTSGGDAPGMNPAIRAALRTGIKWGAKVYGVYCGFDGLINDQIEELKWNSVNLNYNNGGTILLSVRSERFMSKDGRQIAALNLAKRGIDKLLVLGGDGSITGAQVLVNEYKDHINELINKNKLPPDTNNELSVIAIPASIDNDLPFSEYTLGVDSALHRVIESVDSMISTMISHQRIFVIEVMGRNCGWIALMSSFATGADFVFLPEAPIKNWKSEIIKSIKCARSKGKLGIFVIVSEGAIDISNKPIKSQEIVDHVSKNVDNDVRLLKLGHLQRGGPASAIDSISGTLMGIKAIEKFFAKNKVYAEMLCQTNGKYEFIRIEKVLEKAKLIKNFQKEGKFSEVLKRRGKIFNRAFKLYEHLRNKEKFHLENLIGDENANASEQKDKQQQNVGKPTSKVEKIEEKQIENIPKLNNSTTMAESKNLLRSSVIGEIFKKKILILHAGRNVGGMNSALNAAVQYCISMENEIHVCLDGFDGLLLGKFKLAREYEFITSIGAGGSVIGTGHPKETSAHLIYSKIKEYEFDSVIIVGGADSLLMMESLKSIVEQENDLIDFLLIPATTSNNLPCTDMSLGSDTALNVISKAGNSLCLTSMAMKNTVFILEVQGGLCGYLALMGGIAVGAFDSFIPERKYLIGHLSETAQRVKNVFSSTECEGILLLRNEKTYLSISSESFARILKTDSDFIFDTKYVVLGHLQQGANPSPSDRINATVLAIKCIDLILGTDSEKIAGDKKGCYIGVVGVKGRDIIYTDVDDVLSKFDRENRRDKNPTWLGNKNICRAVE